MDNAYAVIMAGGRGERFWPLSTAKRPKQMLSLLGGKPLIRSAVDRLEGLVPVERLIVITSADLVAATCEAVPSLPATNIIGEPFGRDTAAAVALAAAIVGKRSGEDGVFCMLTADHIMQDIPVFQGTLRAGMDIAAAKDVLVTIGITPTFASTGFGYIESGEQKDTIDTGSGTIEFCEALRFVEKPDAGTAKEYIDSGRHYWNSGMFAWSVSTIMGALRRHAPTLAVMADRISAVVDTESFSSALEEEYGKIEKISVDYAIMEKSDNILMAKGSFGWDDVGSWVALENHFEKDDAGNIRIGDCQAVDATGNIVHSEGRLTALIGVEDLVVVQAAGATLVCRKDRAQDVKKMVHKLREDGRYEELL